MKVDYYLKNVYGFFYFDDLIVKQYTDKLYKKRLWTKFITDYINNFRCFLEK